MSLDTATVADTPASGSETTTATPDTSSETTNRYEGIIDIDNPEPDAANPVDGGDQPNAGDEPDNAAGSTEDDDSANAEPDPWEGYEDIEVDGKVLKIPSEAKEYLLRQADYTRKTQEVSARAKELDAREAQIVERQKLSENELDAQVALTQVGAQLKKFENINWAEEKAKAAGDPVAMTELNSLWMEFQELRTLHQQGHEYLNNAAKQRTEQAQQETAKRLAATKAFAEKNIKGWTADLDHQITQWASEQGFTRDMLTAAYTPQVYSVLHKAFQWDQSLKRQKTAKPLPTNSPPAAPTNTVSANGNAVVQKDPSEMSMEEFVAHREAQLARRKR